MRTHYCYKSFLDHAHCDNLVQRAEKSTLFDQDSTISKEGLQTGNYRTSESITLIDRKLMTHLSTALGIEQHKLEPPLLIKYGKGGEFKPHYDFHIAGTENYEERVRNGQRTLSFVFYLNDNYSGGELWFNKLEETVSPKKGELVVIVNQFLDGNMNWDSSHASEPIEEGTKYILLINYTGKYQQEFLEKEAINNNN